MYKSCQLTFYTNNYISINPNTCLNCLLPLPKTNVSNNQFIANTFVKVLIQDLPCSMYYLRHGQQKREHGQFDKGKDRRRGRYY